MNRLLLLAILTWGIPSSASGADDTEDLKAAIAKAAEAPNYSWTKTVKSLKGQWTSEGKIDKDLTWLNMSTMEGFLTGDKWVVKSAEGWKGPGDPAPAKGATPANHLSSLKMNCALPATEAQGLLNSVKLLKSETGGTYWGDLSEDQTKEIFLSGASTSPHFTFIDPKGTIKFWVKNGTLVKFEFRVTGTMLIKKTASPPTDRTTTIEIKSVGTTKIDLPAEARKKLE
jgi:hypothetical protein